MDLMVRRELKARYIGSKMGLLWSYINPLTRFLTFYFVFGIIIGRGQVPNFAIHLFAGMVLVHYFTETFTAGTRSIVRNKAIVKKMAMPREMFPVASMLVSAFHVVPGLVILTVAGVAVGWPVSRGCISGPAMTMMSLLVRPSPLPFSTTRGG